MLSEIIQRAIGRPPAPPADPDPPAQLAHVEQTIATAQQRLAALREQQVRLTEQLGDMTARPLPDEADSDEHREGDDRLQQLRDLDDEIMSLEASLPGLYEQRSTAQVNAKRYERRQLETAQHADLDAQRRVEQAIDRLLVQLLAHVQELQAIEQRCRPRQQRLREMSSDLRDEPPRDPWHSTRLPGRFVEWAHEALRELRRG
jgi:DNA repair exonuclease SbcCD ATPase subunit